MSYGVYSKFDIDKHAATFINYLEVVIDEDGEVHYAVPSHQMFMENILKRRIGEDKFKNMIMEDKEAWYDYLPWLCKKTNCVPVWNEFYYGNPNDKQLQKLQQLKEKKLTDEEIIKDIERSTGMPSYWKKIVLDLIHRQKAEIERLTEELKTFTKCAPKIDFTAVGILECEKKRAENLLNDAYLDQNELLKERNEALKKNTELQKQVDDLKSENTELYKERTTLIAGSILEKQEIFQELYNETIKDGISAVYCMLTPKEIKDRAKRYGVEVD